MLTERLTAQGSQEPEVPLHLSPELQSYIYRCAAQYSNNYDDRQDLFSDIVLSLLEYPHDIQYPERFIRVTARNMAINRRKAGSGAYEIPESGLVTSVDGEAASPIEMAPSVRADETEPLLRLLLEDTLIRMQQRLTKAEELVYSLLQDGYVQADLPKVLGISKQAVSKTLRSIREKYLAAEAE